jgi:hypothetical protein
VKHNVFKVCTCIAHQAWQVLFREEQTIFVLILPNIQIFQPVSERLTAPREVDVLHYPQHMLHLSKPPDVKVAVMTAMIGA